MYHKHDKCPVCGSKDIKNFIICKDHFLSGESFAINECGDCSFRFTNPRPIESELDKYYDSKDYISHNTPSVKLIDFIYRIARKYTLNKKLKLIHSLSPKVSLLDIGCGTGEFLHACKQDGWKIHGVEKNAKARKRAEEILGQKIIPDLFDFKNDGEFNIITLWHVLEHLPDLHGVMSHLKKILSGKGYLIIAVPNHRSYDAEKYKAYWAGYDIPRHLSHFNQKSFKILARLHDFKIKSILPMKLDSFYISLLSEKYRNNRNKYLSSFITGLKSNSYAKKHNNDYSSLIFILKK
ncbi:MAG: class I SAM-dependent methyltransferase [Cyclobacteriaceae bacterium]|nr:class I SAM-dependent methyltransferase [Cyclobacteriaceae bacterium]